VRIVESSGTSALVCDVGLYLSLSNWSTNHCVSGFPVGIEYGPGWDVAWHARGVHLAKCVHVYRSHDEELDQILPRDCGARARAEGFARRSDGDYGGGIGH
jgi:hypothetical protein